MSRKIILHLDVNSYYASLEQQAYPNLRGKPVGVAGKGKGERSVIAGASKEAKLRGVKGAMSSWEALKICPEIIIIPANYERYSFVSQRIFSLMERFSPKVEIFSIDEAYMELPLEIGYQGAEKIALQLKQLIYKQIGEWVTCSIGISYGKTLAKLASELKKPDGLTVINEDNFSKLAPNIKIEEVCGIGFRIGPRLNRAGIFTLQELGNAPRAMLKDMFGEFTGTWLSNIGRGIDDNILRSFRKLPQEKSVGHSYTVPRDLTSTENAAKILLLLSERVGARLRRKGLIAKTVSVYLRFSDRTGWGESQAQSVYMADGLSIYQAARRLMAKLPQNKPIRLVAVTATDLIKQSSVTEELFDQKRSFNRAVIAMDKINLRYGEFTIFRSALAKIRSRIFNLPDGRNKRLFVPNATPFLKRLT